MPGFHIEHVMLKYLISDRCGCGQLKLLTLYDASSGRSDCGESTTSRQRERSIKFLIKQFLLKKTIFK